MKTGELKIKNEKKRLKGEGMKNER